MIRILATAAIVLLLGGCLGKAGPVEQYLRTGGGERTCEQDVAPGKKRVVVALRPVKGSEALDRQAVILAKGRVMSPSLRWYWEASPCRLFEQALVESLRCSTSLAAAWPVRSSTEAALSLTSIVTDFEVQEQPLALTAALSCQVWDGDGVRLIASRSFAVSIPVKMLDAQSIADAGAKALASISAEANNWLESVAAPTAQGETRK